MTLYEKFFNLEIFIDVFPFLLQGLRITITLAITGMILSLLFGLFVALIRISRIPVITNIASFYIDLFRGTPLLVQIIIIFYALPDLGIRLGRYEAGIVALMLNNGAYVAEIFRGGIQAIDKGQMEAARSLGLSYIQAMRRVVLPQALRSTLPALTNSFVALLKDTSLISVIGLEELLKQGRQLQVWTANATPLMAVAIFYFIIVWPMIRLAQRLEKRMAACD
jgi:polar amino acid transport system permease protein